MTPKLRQALGLCVGDQRLVFRSILEEGIANGEVDPNLDVRDALDTIEGVVWACGIDAVVAPNDAIRRRVIKGIDFVLRPALQA